MEVPHFKTVFRHECFKKDMKRLSRKYRTIKEDVETFVQTAPRLYHKLGGSRPGSHGIYQIPGLPFTKPKVYKAKRFACKSLRGTASRSGIRVIYAYDDELDRVELIEIYYKEDKQNEDRKRIERLYASSGAAHDECGGFTHGPLSTPLP